MKQKRPAKKQDSAGVHLWLVLMKAFQALLPHAAGSIKRTELGDSDFRVLEVLLHKGPLPVNTIGPKVWLTPGSISVAVDRLEKTALVKRKNTEDRRVRLVELTPKGRALITETFRDHAAAMEKAAGVLSKDERLMLMRLLKTLGKAERGEVLDLLENETGMHSCLASKPKIAGWRRRQEEASPWSREYRPRSGHARSSTSC